jgi:signal transduction histidine kinase
MQIRVRLTLQFILIAAGILVVSFLYIHLQFKRNLQDEYFDSLRSKALIIAEMVVGTKTDDMAYAMDRAYESDNLLAREYPDNIAIYSMAGQRLYTFNPAPDDIQPHTLEQIKSGGEFRFNQGQAHALGVRYQNKVGKDFLVVAASMFDQYHLVNLTKILIVVFVIAISLMAIGGWIFARQALHPVNVIMNEVDALLPADMSHRLKPSNQHDELSRLVITFNKLLDRIQKAFHHQRMFLSNISHELKNPLTVITSQVEVALQKERSGDEYRHTLQSVLTDVKELNEMSEKLMQLARINTDVSAIQFQSLRIDELIWQAKASLLKNQPEYNIQFDVVNLPEEEEMLLVEGNEQLLRTAFVNLMDNGCKFSEDHRIRVSLAVTREGNKKIEFRDKGSGIPETELQMVFDPFYRASGTNAVKGSGIGLSLVSSILKLHHVDYQIFSEKEKGTTVALTFPPRHSQFQPQLNH